MQVFPFAVRQFLLAVSDVSAAGLAMMPWFTGDFMRSTRGWPLAARAVYRELLDAQWDMGNLPADPTELARMIGASAAEWADGWARCECKFPLVNASHRQNQKLERVRATAFEYHAERSQSGKKGAEARWGKKDGEANGSLNGSANGHAIAQPLTKPMAPSPSPSPSPIHTKPSKEKTKNHDRAAAQPESDQDFELLKMIYPKRGGSQRWGDARRAINARLAEGHTWSEIHAGARRYSLYVKATGKERTEHMQQAATFVGTNKSFLEPWDLPASKAEIRLGSNLSAAEDFMRRTEMSNETH